MRTCEMSTGQDITNFAGKPELVSYSTTFLIPEKG